MEYLLNELIPKDYFNQFIHHLIFSGKDNPALGKARTEEEKIELALNMYQNNTIKDQTKEIKIYLKDIDIPEIVNGVTYAGENLIYNSNEVPLRRKNLSKRINNDNNPKDDNGYKIYYPKDLLYYKINNEFIPIEKIVAPEQTKAALENPEIYNSIPKPVFGIDIFNLEFTQNFNSQKEAARWLIDNNKIKNHSSIESIAGAIKISAENNTKASAVNVKQDK